MAHYIVPPRTYYLVFAALLLLTALTTGVAFVNLGVFSPIVAMTIAVVKALMVVLFFMHLKYGSRLNWVVGATAIFWLGILLALAMSDYLTRPAAVVS
jgi:cytochrome c oxidase subunit 4